MWYYESKVFTDDMVGEHVGFVYLITNKTTNKKYVGKKLFTRIKRYQKNKKVKRTRVESDWLTYTGSNKLLNEDANSGHHLHKEILHLCTSKGWMSYLETQEILNRNAIQSDEYYNEWVSAKIQRKHLK